MAGVKLLSGAADWTPDLRSFSVSRGRSSELAQVDAGTCSLVLDNRARQHDPFAGTAAIYAPVALSWGGLPIFTGHVNSWTQSYQGRFDAISEAACTDDFSVLARRRFTPFVPATATNYVEVIQAAQPTAFWRCNDPPGAVLNASPGTQIVATTAGDLTMSATSPALVGDAIYETGYGAAVLTAGGQLNVASQSASAAQNSDGDPGPSSVFAFEMWFSLAGSLATMAPNPTSIVLGPGDAGGTPKWHIDVDTSNRLIFSVRMNGGATSYSCTSGALSAGTGTWYHVVCSVAGNVARIFLNGVQSASVATVGNFAGTVSTAAGSSMSIHGPNVASTGYTHIAIYAQGSAQFVPSDHYDAGVGRGYVTQASGTRIGAVVTSLASGMSTNLDAGVRSVQADWVGGRTGLEVMQDAVAAENGDAFLFMSAGGVLNFRDSAYRTGLATVATFGDAGGPELGYYDLTFDDTDSWLVNTWQVARRGGAAQGATDGASVVAYGPKSQSVNGLFLTDANAATVASALLAKFKDPLPRVTSLKPKMDDPVVAAAVLAFDLGVKIVVKWTPPGGGSRISQTLYVQKIDISGSASKPFLDCTLGVSPL